MRRIHLLVSDDLLSQITRIAEYERREPRQQALHLLENAVDQAMDDLRIRAAYPVSNSNASGYDLAVSTGIAR